MKLRQLKYFIEVAKEKHFGRASEALYISQSALSQQIQILENEIGVDLFDREKRIKQRRVELTEAGIVFLAEAREIVRRSEEAIWKVRNMANREKELRFGFYSLAMRKWVVDIVTRITREFPHQKVSLVETETIEELQEDLLNGSVDIGLTLLPIVSDTIDTKVYKHDHLSVIMSKRNPLATRNVVSLTDLKDAKWVTLKKSIHPFYDYLENLCVANGFSREKNIVQEASTHEVICSLVSLEIGVAFIPFQFDLMQETEIVARKVVIQKGKTIKVEHALAWKRGTISNELLTFIDRM